MEFIPLYPNAVAPDKIIDNLIELLSDEEYQRGALEWASTPDEPLSPYVLVSESAVWREDMTTPALLIKDVTDEGDDDYPRSPQVLRFSIYQCLALHGNTDDLKREAYRRNAAVTMMILSAKKSGFDLFEGTGLDMGKDVQVKRKHYGDTMPGQASYRRYPSLDVEIRFEESP